MTSSQTYFSLFTKDISDKIDVSRSIKISKRLYEFELSRISEYQTINLRVCIQRKQRNHQLIFKTSLDRDIVHLRNRIHKTDVSCQKNYLITKSDDSTDVWRRIFSNDNDIRRQSRDHCSDQKFSVSRTNKAHRYSNSLYQKKSDRRIYWSVLRAHRSDDSWRSNQITDQRQIRSVFRRFRDWIVNSSRFDHSRDSELWKLDNQVRIKSQYLLLYNLRSTLNVVFAYTERVRKKVLRLYDKTSKSAI